MAAQIEAAPVTVSSLIVSTDATWWGAALLALTAIGWLVLWRLRRRYLGPNEADADGGIGFSIERLDEMLAAGSIDQDEYSRLRNSALGLTRPGERPDESCSSTPGGDDDGLVE